MGYTRNHLTVFTVIDYPEGLQAQIEAEVNELRSRLRPEMARLIVGPIEPAINGGVMYALFPDGSNEGWATSYEGEELRAAFTRLAPCGAAHLLWGDDDDPTCYEGDFAPLEDTDWPPADWHGTPWQPGSRGDAH